MKRQSWLLIVVAALAVGIAARASFLIWSPLPATLDGFRYVRLAEHIITTGEILGSGIESDELIMTLVMAMASKVIGEQALSVAQPLAACIGGTSVVAAVVLVRSLGRSLDWPARRTRHASVVAAFGLAVSGMYLRRTGVPDEETIALVLLPLFTLAAHRFLATRRVSWGIIFGLLAAAYPPTHNMSSLVAAFTLTGLAAFHVPRAETRGDVAVLLGVSGGFWAYFFTYFTVAERVGLPLTYSGLLRDHVGAFLAWLILLAVGAAWLRSASSRAIQGLFGIGVGAWFIVTGANAVAPVFPGTTTIQPVVLEMALLYVVPTALFAWVAPAVIHGKGDAPAVVALLVGPVAVVWFTLATSLTPEFFGTVMRVQAHAHIAAFVLAAVGAVGIAAQRPHVGRAVVVALVIATVLSTPFAFIHLDTAATPRTVHASEFGAASFAATGETYASDHRLARVAPLYYGDKVTGSVGPTRTWLAGGQPPDCLTLAQQAWTTDGAHFYPTPPLVLSDHRLTQWRMHNNLVYSVGGTTETYVALPVNASTGCSRS